MPVATFEDLMVNESGKDVLDNEVPDRRAVIFERQVQQSDEEEPEEFFELTVAEAKRMQRELSEQV